MARIYNNMPGTITVVPGTLFVSTGAITIPPGQRSDSLNWSGSNTITVWDENGHIICTFDFGVHAQIQGGNYAMIQPGSYLVYDSNHDVISTGG
jgi:hypothetical protein